MNAATYCNRSVWFQKSLSQNFDIIALWFQLKSKALVKILLIKRIQIFLFYFLFFFDFLKQEKRSNYQYLKIYWNHFTSNLSMASEHSFAFSNNSAYSMYSARRCRKLSGSLKTTGIEIRVKSWKRFNGHVANEYQPTDFWPSKLLTHNIQFLHIKMKLFIIWKTKWKAEENSQRNEHCLPFPCTFWAHSIRLFHFSRPLKPVEHSSNYLYYLRHSVYYFPYQQHGL